MKKLFFLSAVLLALQTTAQQGNLFLGAELNRSLGQRTYYNTYGMSAAYNRLLPHSNFGIGAGIEFIDIRTRQLGGIMPTLDLRYYARLGRSTVIPMAQAGYNFYRFEYERTGTNQTYTTRGGPGYTLGIGYHYSLKEKGGGPFTALKFRNMQYRSTDPQVPHTWQRQQLNLSIGWRF